MTDLFGWELVYKLSERDINKKEDDLALLIHFLLVRSGFKAIGLGDEKEFTGKEKKSESLPDGWSKENNYSIRYVLDDKLFILKGIRVNQSCVFNLLEVSKLAVTNIAFSVDDSVKSERGELSEIFSNSDSIVKRIRQELISPAVGSTGKEQTTQTIAQNQPRSESSVNIMPFSMPDAQPRPEPEIDPFWNDPDRDPLRVGGADLDPLGRGGGGMIFNPFGQGRGRYNPGPDMGIPGPGLPRGSVPPGARFDPFGPPGLGRGPRPRPPPDFDFGGGYGNMFM